MNCPQDGTLLQMTAREGVEIDYCPKCRGVWLDRGELDKIIERTAAEYTSAQGSQLRNVHHETYDDDDHQYQERHYGHDEKRHDSHNQGHHKKKKEGFLGDLFDF
jgi:uncharacterized protein